MMQKQISDSGDFGGSLRRVFDWAHARNFRGNDPHDILMSPLFSGLGSPLFWGLRSPMLRLAILQLGRRSPVNLRGVLRVPQMENPKAIALFLMGLLAARERATPEWESISADLANRLRRSQHPNGGWGYPFHWQSRTHYLPAGTPTIVCTSFVGKALLMYLDAFEDAQLEETLDRAASYILDVVPRMENEHGLAFGYAENDPQIVFNASLLGAELLARIGARSHQTELIDLAVSAARFVACYEGVNGWGQHGLLRYGLESSQAWTDSFHTAYVIDSLDTIGTLSGKSELKEVAFRLIDTYLGFFGDDGSPRYFRNGAYPIDSHVAAQAIITLSRFGFVAKAQTVADYAIQYLQSPDGYFYYQEHIFYTNRIAYMRWSNAWMFRALSELVVALEKE